MAVPRQLCHSSALTFPPAPWMPHRSLGKTTGLKVKLVLPDGTLEGFQSPGIKGLYREDDAAWQILVGTGLDYRAEDATTMVVGVQARESVSVTAPVVKTFPQQVYAAADRHLAECHRGAAVEHSGPGHRDLRDTLRNVLGISSPPPAKPWELQGDNLTIRGFTARNDIFMDGIRDFGSYYRDSFNFEQVEALEGPAGVQFGRGSPAELSIRRTRFPKLTSLCA